jgi:hypothetical protein
MVEANAVYLAVVGKLAAGTNVSKDAKLVQFQPIVVSP